MLRTTAGKSTNYMETPPINGFRELIPSILDLKTAIPITEFLNSVSTLYPIDPGTLHIHVPSFRLISISYGLYFVAITQHVEETTKFESLDLTRMRFSQSLTSAKQN